MPYQEVGGVEYLFCVTSAQYICVTSVRNTLRRVPPAANFTQMLHRCIAQMLHRRDARQQRNVICKELLRASVVKNLPRICTKCTVDTTTANSKFPPRTTPKIFFGTLARFLKFHWLLCKKLPQDLLRKRNTTANEYPAHCRRHKRKYGY